MGTFFLIYVQPDKGRAIELGPYLTLKEASEIFTEHVQTVLTAQGIKTKQYTVQLVEVYPTPMGWATIGLKVKATETYNLEDDDEQSA